MESTSTSTSTLSGLQEEALGLGLQTACRGGEGGLPLGGQCHRLHSLMLEPEMPPSSPHSAVSGEVGGGTGWACAVLTTGSRDEAGHGAAGVIAL